MQEARECPVSFPPLRTLYFCQHRARGAPSTSRCRRREEGPPCGLNLLHTPELISDCWAVTALACITPGNNWSISQTRSKCLLCGPNLLHTLELISNCWAATTTVFFTPGNDRSISQKGSKCLLCGLNLLYAPELSSNCRAVTTTMFAAPGNDWPISQNCSKCRPCSLNLYIYVVVRASALDLRLAQRQRAVTKH